MHVPEARRRTRNSWSQLAILSAGPTVEVHEGVGEPRRLSIDRPELVGSRCLLAGEGRDDVFLLGAGSRASRGLAWENVPTGDWG